MESRAPQRTCIGCRRKDDQERFLRVSRNPHGELSFSQEKQRTGRGAYVCPNPECLEAALKADRLSRALKQPVSKEEKEALKAGFLQRG
jgi:predicted RNA-binding protein YlxR (DUF448 family)